MNTKKNSIHKYIYLFSKNYRILNYDTYIVNNISGFIQI